MRGEEGESETSTSGHACGSLIMTRCRTLGLPARENSARGLLSHIDIGERGGGREVCTFFTPSWLFGLAGIFIIRFRCVLFSTFTVSCLCLFFSKRASLHSENRPIFDLISIP